MKKLICALVAMALCVGIFSSCTAEKKTVQVGTATVGAGIYSYFLDLAGDGTDEEKAKQAEQSVLKYVAVNTKFDELSLSLTAEQKSLASKNTNNLWHLFGDYYTRIGVSKGDLYKIHLSDEYRKAIIRSIYDKDGTSPVTEDAIKAYFSDNFVAFKAIIELLQTTDEDGKTVHYSDEKIVALTNQFNQMKESMDDGTSFEKVEAAYLSKDIDDDSPESEVLLISKTDRAFPSGTFDEISKIERDGAGVFTRGNYMFLVQRIGELSDKTYYENNRDKCLIALESENFDAQLTEWAEKLK